LAFADLLTRSIRCASAESVLESSKALFKLFFDVFEFEASVLLYQASFLKYLRCFRYADPVPPKDSAMATQQLEESFLNMVLKLNENVFKPFFLRLHDWAILDAGLDGAFDWWQHHFLRF
jgi:BP28CT (NUC211) domain